MELVAVVKHAHKEYRTEAN